MAAVRALRALGVRSSGAMQVLGGQAACSLVNFLTLLAIGAWSGSEELGVYALGFSCHVLAISLGDTLVATPYTYFRARIERDPRDLEAAAAWGTLLIALAASAALTLAWWLEASSLARLWPVLPLAIVCGLMREWRRRQLVASNRLPQLLRVDLAASVTQLAGVTALGVSGHLSAWTAYVVVALAAWVALIPMRSASQWRRIPAAWGDLPPVLRAFFAYGRWLFVGGVFHVGSVQLYPWLALIGGGERQAGVYAACAALVNLVGPLLVGLTNYFRPRFMVAWQNHSAARFQVYVVARMGVFVVPALAVAAVAVVAGASVLALLYGEDFRAGGPALSWMSLGMCAVAASAALQLALLAMRAPVTNLYYHGSALMMLAASAWWMRDSLTLLTLGQMYGVINLIAALLLASLLVVRLSARDAESTL